VPVFLMLFSLFAIICDYATGDSLGDFISLSNMEKADVSIFGLVFFRLRDHRYARML
jgi:hypothetical protein